MFDPQVIKKDFPIFQTHPKLVYLDSAATTQKPASVLEAVDRFSREKNANVHRGLYALSEAATAAYEGARQAVAAFFHARGRQVVFTRNATEAINLVALTWGRVNLGPDDVVLVSEMEHHSNIVPWQLLREQQPFRLEVIPITATGELDVAAAEAMIRPGVKLVAITKLSNVLGVAIHLKDLVSKAHQVGARVLVDGAQAGGHLPVDLSVIDADFFAFSGHKMLGPFGIGGLIARTELLEAMPPFLGGGDMIAEVTWDRSSWNEVPAKFEAGTPNVSGAVGLSAAIAYLQRLGPENVWAHEQALTRYALERLDRLPGFRSYGPRGDHRGGIVTFSLDGIHPHDIASLLDERQIAVRAGHHCAQPLHAKLGLTASARASFSVYTAESDVDALVDGLREVQRRLG